MKQLARLAAAAFAPAELTLGRLLWIAFAIRIPAILFARGFEYLDHQFQYVDPAYHLAFDASWWQPFDYVDGHRSWVYPGFLAGVFRVIDALGIHEADAMMTATRAVHAVLSLVPVAAFWQLVVRWRGLTGQRALLLFFACNPLMVYCSVQPTGPTVGALASLTALCVFEGRRLAWPFAAGLLSGIAFACRFQDAIFGLVIFGATLVQRRFAAATVLAAGALLAVAGQGFVDLLTWGSFMQSPLHYLRTNLAGGEAERFTQPFWYFLVIAIGLLGLFPPFVRSGWRGLRVGGAVFPVLLVAALCYLGIHSLIPRKSFRFVLPALILLTTVGAAGLLPRRADDSRPRIWHRRALTASHLLLLAIVSLHYFNRGPVEAARALSRLPDFQDRLLMIDGGQDAVGGHYYLRRAHLDVTSLASTELAAWLAANQPPSPIYALSNEIPLDPARVAPPWHAIEVGAFTDLVDLRRSSRRFVYRLERTPDR